MGFLKCSLKIEKEVQTVYSNKLLTNGGIITS